MAVAPGPRSCARGHSGGYPSPAPVTGVCGVRAADSGNDVSSVSCWQTYWLRCPLQAPCTGQAGVLHHRCCNSVITVLDAALQCCVACNPPCFILKWPSVQQAKHSSACRAGQWVTGMGSIGDLLVAAHCCLRRASEV